MNKLFIFVIVAIVLITIGKKLGDKKYESMLTQAQPGT